MKIKKGDIVSVVTGKDRGKRGRALRILPSSGKIVVENINLRKKSVRPKKAGKKGEIVEFPAPMDVSNLKLVCPKCSKPSKIGYLIKESGKLRMCKSCKQEI